LGNNSFFFFATAAAVEWWKEMGAEEGVGGIAIAVTVFFVSCQLIGVFFLCLVS